MLVASLGYIAEHARSPGFPTRHSIKERLWGASEQRRLTGAIKNRLS
jgi:hypothetical protein